MLASGSAFYSIGMLQSPKGALLRTQCHPQMRPGCLNFAQAFILGKLSLELDLQPRSPLELVWKASVCGPKHAQTECVLS